MGRLHCKYITVKPVLCDLQREHWQKVTLSDRWLLDVGSISMKCTHCEVKLKLSTCVILLHVYYCPPVMFFLVSCYFMFITDHMWCYSWCHVASCLLLTTCDVIPGVILLHVYLYVSCGKLLFVDYFLSFYSWCRIIFCWLHTVKPSLRFFQP